MKLSKETQELLDQRIDATKEEINNFYIDADMRTHYILFLNYLQVIKYVKDLEKEGKILLVNEVGTEELWNDDGVLLNYIIEHFPHKKITAMFYASLDYFHPGETEKYNSMSHEELEAEKEKLKNKQGLWKLIDEEKITRLEQLEKTYQEGLKAKAEEVPYEGVPKNIQEAMKSGEGFVHREIENYTLEELQEIYKNLPPMTEEEMKNTFIEDDEPIDLSKLKL